MSAPSLLHCFMAPASSQDTKTAAIAAPNNKRIFLTKEEQAQWDTNTLRQVLEEVDHKCDMMLRPPRRNVR